MKLSYLALACLGLVAVSLTTGGLTPDRTLAADEPKLPTPFNLSCNTDADEDDPHVSSDLRTLFYSSNTRGNWDIYYAVRSATNQPWSKGRLLEDYVSTDVDDRSVFLQDGRYPHYLFFATKKDENINNFDIYVAVKQ